MTSGTPRPIPVSAADVVRLLHYDPKTGVVTNRVSRGTNAPAGSEAGTCDIHGRGRKIMIAGYTTYTYRWIWLYCHGYMPSHDIDHADGNPWNDTFHNLRECRNGGVNMHNQTKADRKSQTGVLGVRKRRRSAGFYASIVVNREHVYLGHYPTVELARAAYVEAKRKVHKFGML